MKLFHISIAAWVSYEDTLQERATRWLGRAQSRGTLVMVDCRRQRLGSEDPMLTAVFVVGGQRKQELEDA